MEERKRLVKWVMRMYQAYVLLCDKGDKPDYIAACKAESLKARDTIIKAIWTGDFDMKIINAMAIAEPAVYEDFAKLLNRGKNKEALNG